jgi:hypothetical protein
MIKLILNHKAWRQIFTPLAYRREQQRIAYLNQVEADVGAYFDKLPRCTAKIALASPAYYRNHPSHEPHRFSPDSIRSDEMRGEIYIASLELADFLITQQEQHGSWGESGIWIDGLIGWLKNADLSAEVPTAIPREIKSKTLDARILEILKKCSIEVFCWDCRKHYLNLVHESHLPKLMKGWNFIEETWSCESGHLMFKFIEEMHLIGHFPRAQDST